MFGHLLGGAVDEVDGESDEEELDSYDKADLHVWVYIYLFELLNNIFKDRWLGGIGYEG